MEWLQFLTIILFVQNHGNWPDSGETGEKLKKFFSILNKKLPPENLLTAM